MAVAGAARVQTEGANNLFKYDDDQHGTGRIFSNVNSCD